MKKLTATKAIELTLETRLLMLDEGLRTLPAVSEVARKHSLQLSNIACILCSYSEEQKEASLSTRAACNYCPFTILTGEGCIDPSNLSDPYQHGDLEMGVSRLLAIQYYWDKRFNHKKKGEK